MNNPFQLLGPVYNSDANAYISHVGIRSARRA